MAQSDGALIINTELDRSGLAEGMRQAQSDTNKFSAAASSALGNMAAQAAGQVASAVKNAFKQAADFVSASGSAYEASMSQVSATMGITALSQDYEKLSAAAKKMGAETKYSATEAGDALNYLALAGYSAEQAVSALPTVLNVAAAGNIDLASASDMITDSMSALGLGMDELEGFSDKLAKTSQKSNTSVAQLGEAILTVGGTAKSLKGGVEELDTMLGLIADNGIKGAEGGTALRNVILSLSAPTDKAADALKKLNVEAFDDSGNLRELSDIFAELNSSMEPLTEQAKTEILNEIFNKVDLKAVNALLGTSSERFEELRGYIEDCDGAAAQMAETMSDNLQGDLQILNSSLESVGISTYEKFTEPMRTSVQEISGILGDLNTALNGELGDKLENLGEKFGDLAVKAADFAVNEGLPKLIDGLEWLIDNGDELLTAAETAGALVIAYKGLTAADKAATAISSVTTALTGAATAQGALNTTMAACPWAAAIAGAAALGIVIRNAWEKDRELVGWEGEVQQAYKSSNEELARKIGLYDELAQSSKKAAYEEAKAGLAESTAQYEKNIAKIRDLKRALQYIDGDMEHQLYVDTEQEIAGLKDQNDILQGLIQTQKYYVDQYGKLYETGMTGSMSGEEEARRRAMAHFGIDPDAVEEQTAAQADAIAEGAKTIESEWAKLDHDYAMGVISSDEELYSKRLGLLRDYGDASNTEHWKYFEAVAGYEQDHNDKMLKEQEEAQKASESSLKSNLDTLSELYNKKYSEILDAKKSYRQKLMSVGGNVLSVETIRNDDGTETKEYKINDVNAQISQMRAFHEDIKKLKEDGASSALLDELNSLSAEDSANMANYIANLSDAERAQVIALYDEKQRIADELSADLYTKDAEKLQKEYYKAITNLGVGSYDAGKAAAEQWADGFNGTLSELIDKSVITAAADHGMISSAKTGSGTTASTKQETTVGVNVDVKGGPVYLDGEKIGEYALNYIRKKEISEGG